MTKKRSVIEGFLIFITLLSSACIADAQVFHPEDGFLFDDSEVPRIDLTLSQSNLQSLYADPESNTEYFAVFYFTRGDSTLGPLDVGVRFRGDTLRNKQKKYFRISFNSIDENFELDGIEKMDLNAEVNDPSLIRSKLGWELFRYLGVACPRSNHILLYINDKFYGVYLNTEHIDERFVKTRFDNNDGNLYRNLFPADLAYLGPSQNDYKYEYDGRRAYALRTNEKWDDYEDLAALIVTLDQSSGEQLKAELERLINVQQVLKVMAVDVMSGNWDGYTGNRNNYYLYRDQVTGRFEYIPYNLENSFGIDFRGVDWSSRSIYDWNLDLRPLYEKVLEVEEYKAQYTMYIKQLAAYTASAGLGNELTRWSQQIRDDVAMDTFYTKDWGFSISDFDGSLNSGWGEHVDLGVLEFITARNASALAEAVDSDAIPLFSHVRVKPRSDRIDLDWTVEDDETGFTTTLHYRIDGGVWTTLLKDTPTETDPISGTFSYRDTIPSLNDTTEVEIYFTVVDQGEQENRYPDTTLTISYPLLSGPLYINEFMASNKLTKKDEFGEYDDWAEIYNATGEQIWLADYFLSDNNGTPGKYRFPEQYIEPHGFYLVWLDDQGDQGVNHATFKISKDGEKLRLSGRPSTGFQLIDSVDFGLQETDISLGRSVDGGPVWIAFPSPTPYYSNLKTSVYEYPDPAAPLSVYPNPVSEGVLYFNKRVSGMIYNTMGQLMMELKDAEYAGIHQLGAGLYIIRTREGESIQFIVIR
jgi:spore coat protein H